MAELIALSNWLNTQSEHTVAVDLDKVLTTSDLKNRVNIWLNILSEQSGERWAVYHSDSFEFTAILLALWQLNKTACVPGDICAGTVERLQNHVNGFIGDFPAELVLDVDDDFTHNSAGSETDWQTLPADFVAIEIYTSGSTGEPKPISKTISQLEQELATLETQWPSQQDGVVLATVSHQHLYGMTFRLFWPLCAGKAFSQFTCEYSEDIYHHAKHYSSFCLVASPSHLARINQAMSWQDLRQQCQYVISSAAPLLRSDSLLIGQLLDTHVREIYGSSETGAMAWRMQQQSDDDALWQALPEVELQTASDNTLIVLSPYLANRKPLSLPDKVKFHSETEFELIGRTDNIAKVEGKRVSLTAIERLLLENDWVADVKALTLSRKRVEVAIVMQLTQMGGEKLQKAGRKAVINSLKNSLKNHLESVVLPRRWRFVEHMPYNSQGKLPLNTLHALFDKEPTKWPTITNTKQEEGQTIVECFVPAEIVYFDGHFENSPILPGVVQVYWAEKLGRELLGIAGNFKRLEVIKFLQIISPNSNVALSLDYNETKHVLTFSYQSEKGLHSSGKICFG